MAHSLCCRNGSRRFGHFCLREQAFVIKVILVGDRGVGKSHLLGRFYNDMFEVYRCPLGVPFVVRTINVEGNSVKFYVFDTNGEERFKAVSAAYYRGAIGALLVYDISKRETYEHLEYWLNQIRDNACDEIPVMLVGNKSDLHRERAISLDEATVFAGKNRISFIETSALNSTNVDTAFENIFKEIHYSKDTLDRSFFAPSADTVKVADDRDSRKSFCCKIW